MTTVGRNAPCPCGSGRKYKRCCYARDAAARAAGIPAPGSDGTPSRYFGYDATAPADAGPFGFLDLPQQGLTCMVFRIGPEDLAELRARMSFVFAEGDWAVSTGAHEETVVHGPFPALEAAFDFGRDHAGAVRSRSDVTADLPPEFF